MVANLSSETGLSGQTTKSQEMARAFSPANNNRQNMQEDLTIKPEKSGVVKAEESKQTQESTTGVPSPAQQQRTVQSAAGMPEVQAMLGNLGIFNINLTAGVNKFVNSAPFSSANAQLTKGGTPIFNQATGKWELPQNAEVQAQTGGLVGEKLGQQEELRAMAGDMFDENGTAKTFEQVLKKFGDKNGDGVIDAQEQLWLNEAFDIVNGIRRLRNENPFSAQAQALRSQLAAKDRNGMVSGLIQALDEYDQIVNKRVTGAEADAYYLKDLLTMGQDKIQQEVQKALTESSGLFGSDYETYLKREVDKSAQEYQDAAEEDASVMQVIKEVADAWIRGYEGEFRKAKDTLNTMFRGASDSLIENLRTLEKSGNKGIQQAMDWFVDTQTLVNTGNKDFGTIIFQALVDSPLGAESKRIIKKWLGETIGQDVAEKGVLTALLEKIAGTGYFWTEDQNGNQIQVSLNAQQKMDVVRIINDPNKSDAQKADEIEGFISAMSRGMGTRLEQDLSTVTTPIKSGSLATALNNWRGAMTESFSGFDDSLVQAGYGSTVASIGRNNSPQVMQATIEQHAQKKLDDITAALQEVDKSIGELQARVTKDAAILQQNVTRGTELQAIGQNSVSQNYRNAFEQYKNYASSVGSSTINDKPTTYVEAAWFNSKGTAAPPPNMVAVYAPVQAARSMVQHLRGTSEQDLKDVYTVLLRDYFGGNEEEITKMITGDLFSPEVQASAAKAARAFQDPNFGASVFATTRSAQALNQRTEENNQMLQQAQAKLSEATAAKAELQRNYAQVVQALQTSTKGAKIQTAQAYNAAVDGNFGPLTSNVPQETANRLFNMAIDGQSMPFTSMPKIDINKLRATGNIQYVERGAGLDPSGYGQYVEQKFVPAGSITATSMPVNDVGGPIAPVQSRIPDTAAKTEGIPAAAPITEESLQAAIDKVRPEAKGDPATTVTKIEPTENKDILMVTTADGNRVPFSKSAWSTGVYPDYDPADPGVFKPANEALKPQYPQQEEKPAAGILDGVTDYLKGLFKSDATKQAEAAKVAAENQSRESEKAKIAKANNDAIFGLPPQSSDPVYREEYDRVKAEQDRRAAAKAGVSSESSNRNESKENSEREKSETPKPTNVFRGGRNQYMEE